MSVIRLSKPLDPTLLSGHFNHDELTCIVKYKEESVTIKLQGYNEWNEIKIGDAPYDVKVHYDETGLEFSIYELVLIDETKELPEVDTTAWLSIPYTEQGALPNYEDY